MDEQPEIASGQVSASVGPRVAAVRPKVKKLLEQFRAEPSGDAGALLEALLLKGLVEESAEREDLLRLQAERERRVQLEAALQKMMDRAHQLGRVTERLARRRAAEQNRIKTILTVVEKAAAQGRPFDQAEVVRRISAVIGLEGPLERRVEPRGPEEGN